jgi:hypothetical protein
MERYRVTFQIAMVGRDGIVVGSDRRQSYTAPPNAETGKPLRKLLLGPKYFISPDTSMVCFAAGAGTHIELARRISTNCVTWTSEREWLTSMESTGCVPPLPAHDEIPDEVLIVRRDSPKKFWLVLRRHGMLPKAFPELGYAFAGTCVYAQFLALRLWRPTRSVSDLKKLALLTLAYAAHEESGAVCGPFDLLTLAEDGHMTWSEHDVTHDAFQTELERAFNALSFD